jgi:hypothetical protein
MGCFTNGERLPGSHYVGVVQPLVTKGHDRYCELVRGSRVSRVNMTISVVTDHLNYCVIFKLYIHIIYIQFKNGARGGAVG